MKLLMTGATGFIGRTLLLRVLKEKRYEQIFVLIRTPKKLEAQLREEGFNGLPAEVIPLCAEAPDWAGIELPEADHVVHSAGTLFARGKDEYFKINVEGTCELFRRLPNHSRILVLSSQAAGGPCPSGAEWRTESDTESPLTWYGKSKLEMERTLQSRFPNHEFVCLRPPMVLGPRDTATLPLFKLAALPIRVKPGFSEKFYSFIAVTDLVDAIFKVLWQPGLLRDLNPRVFFVASPQTISDRQLIEGAANALGKRGCLIPIPQAFIKTASWVVDSVPALRSAVPTLTKDRAQEIWPDRWVVSSSRFERVFGWQARTGLEETLKQTCDWYLKSGQLSN